MLRRKLLATKISLRYFLELSYNGSRYSGFQVQENANTVQAEVEKALQTYFRKSFELTGSSRTDTGVHALQNFFHFDTEELIADPERSVYHVNAILPPDIAVRALRRVGDDAHARFDAISRKYEYRIYQSKDPFLKDAAFFYPYPLDIEKLNHVAESLKTYTDFTSFSKRNTQVKTFNCKIMEVGWAWEDKELIFRVRGDRFLRGMVRGLTGTMLRVGSSKISEEEFKTIVESKDCSKADFSVPAHALYLVNVEYPSNIFID